MEHLHKEVTGGWIVYLDDDNLLYDKYGIATALTHARSPSDLLLWRAKLGRLVPLDKNFGATGVVRGDCDSANFMCDHFLLTYSYCWASALFALAVDHGLSVPVQSSCAINAGLEPHHSKCYGPRQLTHFGSWVCVLALLSASTSGSIRSS